MPFVQRPASCRVPMAKDSRRRKMLPAQAIIRDKDTWLSGSGGFDLTSIRAGG
jgi:hypothetical protein